jgi:hypothetical protein
MEGYGMMFLGAGVLIALVAGGIAAASGAKTSTAVLVGGGAAAAVGGGLALRGALKQRRYKACLADVCPGGPSTCSQQTVDQCLQAL